MSTYQDIWDSKDRIVITVNTLNVHLEGGDKYACQLTFFILLGNMASQEMSLIELFIYKYSSNGIELLVTNPHKKRYYIIYIFF